MHCRSRYKSIWALWKPKCSSAVKVKTVACCGGTLSWSYSSIQRFGVKLCRTSNELCIAEKKQTCGGYCWCVLFKGCCSSVLHVLSCVNNYLIFAHATAWVMIIQQRPVTRAVQPLRRWGVCQPLTSLSCYLRASLRGCRSSWWQLSPIATFTPLGVIWFISVLNIL